MADPFVAEIRIVGFDFAPMGWATCDGQLLPISQNTALFSLLGTNYGGDGRSIFGLPNLQGSAPMGAGQGPGLTLRNLGETGGSVNVTLLTTELPAHSHLLNAGYQRDAYDNPEDPLTADPTGQFITIAATDVFSNAGADTSLAPQSISITGGSQPHNNMMPYLVLTFIIAMQGVYPPRS